MKKIQSGMTIIKISFKKDHKQTNKTFNLDAAPAVKVTPCKSPEQLCLIINMLPQQLFCFVLFSLLLNVRNERNTAKKNVCMCVGRGERGECSHTHLCTYIYYS